MTARIRRGATAVALVLTIAMLAAAPVSADHHEEAETPTRALPESYPPEYGAAAPLALMTSTFSVVLFPLFAIPALAFDGTDGVSYLWDWTVADPMTFLFRDRTGESQY